MMPITRFIPGRYSTVDRYFDEDFRDLFRSEYGSKSVTVPSVNVKENDNEYQIELAAPGINKDDLSIQMENNLLTISLEHEEEVKDEDENYTRREFNYQTFERTFNVPEDQIDTEKIDANYSDGILRVRLPKLDVAKAKPTRNIKVK